MNRRLANTVLLLTLLSAGAPSQAQKRITAETPVSGAGEVQFGFNGGNTPGNGNTQSVLLGIDGVFQGYWRDPRIVSFNLSPNWRWDHENSAEMGSSMGDQGVSASLHFLGGSSIPLTFNYSLTRVAESSLTGGLLPVTVQSVGLSQNFGVSWNWQKIARNGRRRWPTLALSYDKGLSDSSVTGINAPELTSSSNSYFARTSYQFFGFRLNGSVNRMTHSMQSPDLLHLGTPTETNTVSTGESLSLSRNLVRNTSLGASYSRSNGSVQVVDSPSSQRYESASAQLNSNPFTRLSLYGNTDYTSNSAAQTLLTVLTTAPTTSSAALTAPQLLLSSGREFQAGGGGNYLLTRSLQVLANMSHLKSDIQNGVKLDDNVYSAGLLYSRSLAKGSLAVSYAPAYYTVLEDFRLTNKPTLSEVKMHGLINAGNGRYARRFGRWLGQAGASYSRSHISEPFPIALVSSSLSTNLSASTLIAHQWNFTGNWSLNHSDYAGANSAMSNSISGNIGNRTWSFMGQYQFNNGYSISTPYGLVPLTGTTPAPNILSTFYNSTNGFSVSVSYGRRRLRVTGTYSNTGAEVDTPLQVVTSGNSIFDSTLTYKLRKVDIRGGFRRFSQHVSNNGFLDRASYAYYVSLVRPFRIF